MSTAPPGTIAADLEAGNVNVRRPEVPSEPVATAPAAPANADHDPDALELLFPGEAVEVAGANGTVTLQVYPMGVAHIPQFRRAIGTALSSIQSSGLDMKALLDEVKTKKADADVDWAALLAPLGPAIVDELHSLVCDCTHGPIDLRDPRVPHWVMAQCVNVFLRSSFGGEHKVRPWMDLVDGMLESVVGVRVGLWETLSSIFAKMGTTESPSSGGTTA